MDSDARNINDLDECLDDDPTSELEALPEKFRVNVEADESPHPGAQTLLLMQQIEDLSARNKQLESELDIRNELVDLYRREIKAMKQTVPTSGNQQMSRLVSEVEEIGPAAPVQGAVLVGLNGDASTRYAIGPGRTTLGSSADNDIQLKSNFISRHHAQIVCSSGDYILGDLNSTNGVFVNSNRIKRHALREGDLITIGTLRLKFQTDSGRNQTQNHNTMEHSVSS